MKKTVKTILAVVAAVVLLAVPTFAAGIDDVAKNAETIVRGLVGSFIGISAAIYAVKEFLRKDMVKAVMVVIFGGALTIFIGKPEWIISISDSIMTKLMG